MPSLTRMTRRTLVLCASAVMTPPARGADERSVTDCRGRRVRVGFARRIACAGGTITETLYALGAQGRVVAVDVTSTWPPEALRDRKSLGYMRTLSAEGILSLRPDLVLAMNDAGPPAALDQLMAAAVPIVFVDATPSPDAILARTRFLADVVDLPAAGARLGGSIERGFATLRQWRLDHAGGARKVLFVMRMQNGRPLAAGSGTAAASIIGLAGHANAASGMQGYKILNDEAVVALAPDVILLMDQDAAAIRPALLASPAFALTPAGRRRAIVSMEGERMLGFGPRTPGAALDLARMIDMAGKTI
ncbi:hemin ABC transporter substrate-binding protein [Gluconacetobacter sacchari]